MAETVPVYSDLGLVYDAPEAVSDRYKEICVAFEKAFGSAPEALARAPGRVNLIGEHIDYEGYGVLPMAIAQDTIVAIKRGGTQLEVAHLHPEKYPTKSFEAKPNQDVDVAHHTWANYFVCAYKGVHELLEAEHGGAPEPIGLQVLVHGVVPTGSGLSSSAAIICSSMLAILAAYGKLSPPQAQDSSSSILKAQVAAFAAKAEHYVGVSCGGMDQAISMMGMKGVAKKVDFSPVRAQDVSLPPGVTFVIANSLSVSDKAVGAERRYNMRVVECRLAAMLLALALGQDRASLSSSINTLMDVEPLIEARYGSRDQAVQAVQDHLHEGQYTLEEIEGSLGLSLDKLYSNSAVGLKVLGAGRQDGGFKLRNRALHVYQEAARVTTFKSLCDSDADAEATALGLGALMDASHASCSQLYECSSKELEELVGAAKECGALGARLTGAGWGGCGVFLVREAEVGAFLAALKTKYFTSSRTALVPELDMDSVLFASRPSAGAAVLYLKGLTADGAVPQPLGEAAQA